MGCALTEATLQKEGLKLLDTTQAKELVVGNTVVGRTANGGAFTVLFRATGTSAGISGTQGNFAGSFKVLPGNLNNL